MSGKVVLGIGIGALAGAAIFGAGFWIARRAMPVFARQEMGLRVMLPGVGPHRGEVPHDMPFGGGMPGWMGPMGPEGWIGPAPFGHLERGFSISLEPLTEAQAREAVEAFLVSTGQDGLRVGEVLTFEDHAYAVVEKTATGSGAFEVLVLPGPRGAHVAYAPTTRWNTEYGRAGQPMLGGDPLFGLTGPDPSVTPSVTTDHAAEIARTYLESRHPGVELGEARAFPGYFTIPFKEDGTLAGMLSVNAYTGEVWEFRMHALLVESGE